MAFPASPDHDSFAPGDVSTPDLSGGHGLRNPTDGLYRSTLVVHRAHGFRFVIYTLDHEPAHIHITGAGQAKINLLGPDGAPEVVFSIGIKRSDMRRLVAEVAERRDDFLEEWERIHGQRQ